MGDWKIESGRLFMVIGYGGWGKAPTFAKAIAEWRRNAFVGTKKSVKVKVFDAPKSAYINDFGGVTYKAADKKPVLLGETTVKS